MNQKLKIDKELFFYIGLFFQIFYVARIITINSYNNSALFIFIILVCSLITVAMSQFNKREFYLFFILLICAGIHLLITEDSNLLRLVLLVFSGKGIDSDFLKKNLCIAYPTVFFGVWLLSKYFGLNDVVQEGVWRVAAGWETRYTLGFDGPTRMMFIWLCCIISIQLYTNRLNLVRDIAFLLFSFYLFKISVSYTGVITAIIAIIMPYICNFVVKTKSFFVLKYFVYGALILVLSLTAITMLIDISKTGFGLWLNGRTYSLHYMFANGIYPSLFGGELVSGVKGLDNSYFYNMYVLGIIPMCFMIIAIVKLGKVFALKKNIMGISATVTFIFVAYVTQMFEYPFLNYFLFLIIENWENIINPIKIYDNNIVEL